MRVQTVCAASQRSIHYGHREAKSLEHLTRRPRGGLLCQGALPHGDDYNTATQRLLVVRTCCRQAVAKAHN